VTFASYLVAFAVDLWVSLHGVAPGRYRQHEIAAVAEDVASTTATPLEALTLMDIAAWESGYERSARGRQHECGAFQVMPPYRSCDAREALSRLRAQGIIGYVGCSTVTPLCEAMAERRTLPAKVYFWSHPWRGGES
jgi:hypothetical protein